MVNGPFPSCIEPHYESKAKCKVFIVKISFDSHSNKTNFRVKSFALSLAFIIRLHLTATQWEMAFWMSFELTRQDHRVVWVTVIFL